MQRKLRLDIKKFRMELANKVAEWLRGVPSSVVAREPSSPNHEPVFVGTPDGKAVVDIGRESLSFSPPDGDTNAKDVAVDWNDRGSFEKLEAAIRDRWPELPPFEP